MSDLEKYQNYFKMTFGSGQYRCNFDTHGNVILFRAEEYDKEIPFLYIPMSSLPPFPDNIQEAEKFPTLIKAVGLAEEMWMAMLRYSLAQDPHGIENSAMVMISVRYVKFVGNGPELMVTLERGDGPGKVADISVWFSDGATAKVRGEAIAKFYYDIIEEV